MERARTPRTPWNATVEGRPERASWVRAGCTEASPKRHGDLRVRLRLLHSHRSPREEVDSTAAGLEESNLFLVSPAIVRELALWAVEVLRRARTEVAGRTSRESVVNTLAAHMSGGTLMKIHSRPCRVRIAEPR